MAPNTALCFSFTGIAIALSTGMIRKLSSPINAIFGSLILGLGVVALLGYVLELEAAYGWGRLTRMALHTALGFIIVGSGLLASGWKSARTDDKPLPPWLPVPAAIAVLTVTFSLWQAVHPGRALAAIQRSQDLVLFFGIALAAALAFAIRNVVSESASLRQLEFEIDDHRKTQKMLRERDIAEQICQRRPALKVLYMSGYTRNAIIHHGQLDRDAVLLKKPFTKTDLARKFRSMLD